MNATLLWPDLKANDIQKDEIRELLEVQAEGLKQISNGLLIGEVDYFPTSTFNDQMDIEMAAKWSPPSVSNPYVILTLLVKAPKIHYSFELLKIIKPLNQNDSMIVFDSRENKKWVFSKAELEEHLKTIFQDSQDLLRKLISQSI